VQVVATIDEELEVIEPGAELAELLAGVRAMTDETEHQLAVRLDAADVAHASVIRGEVVSLPHAQELGVPRRAAYRITNVRLTSTRPVIVGTPKSLSAAVASGMPTTSRRWRDYPLARGGIARGVRTVTSKEQSSCSAFGTARAVDVHRLEGRRPEPRRLADSHRTRASDLLRRRTPGGTGRLGPALSPIFSDARLRHSGREGLGEESLQSGH